MLREKFSTRVFCQNFSYWNTTRNFRRRLNGLSNTTPATRGITLIISALLSHRSPNCWRSFLTSSYVVMQRQARTRSLSETNIFHAFRTYPIALTIFLLGSDTIRISDGGIYHRQKPSN